MPIGYLVPVLLAAWCTLCAVSPRHWALAPGQVRFRCSMLINELPCLGFYWLLAATLPTVAQNELTSPIGWLAFAISCLTAIGMAVILARQCRAAAILDVRLSRRQAVRLVLAPTRARRREVERIADVSYGDGGAANTLDLYRSRSGAAQRPVLIHLHGGALHSGRKDHEGLPLIYGLAARGWVCISANYRLSPKATFPDPLIDVKKVVAWVRAHGAAYGADPNLVFVAGGSAGAQLAVLTALTANEPSYQPGFEAIDTTVAGVVALYGVYGPRSAPGIDPGSDALPANHLNAAAPPVLVVHGDADTVLAVEGARDFVADLRVVSNSPVVYSELPGTQHAFDMFRSLRSAHVVTAVEQFTDHVLRGQLRPRPPQHRRH